MGGVQLIYLWGLEGIEMGLLHLGQQIEKRNALAKSCSKLIKDSSQKEKQLIYLASHYSSPDPEVRAYRYKKAIECAADLIKQGYLVFSPIAHSHEIAQRLGKDFEGFESWRELDLRMLASCNILVVAEIEGWEESCGVKIEMRKARKWNIKVKFCIFDGELGNWRVKE